MAGHNKWSQIKHKKAKTDAQKGKVFSKMARELTMAAKLGGGDPDMNARLRLAIQKAKDANMPNDNISRAIEKGAGGGDDSSMEEIQYEAYGPGGVAFLIDTLTDNKNRTVSNIRAILTRANGSLANKGSVAYLFDQKGVIICNIDSDEDKVMTVALEAGAEDIMTQEDGSVVVTTEPSTFEDVRKALEGASILIEAAEISRVAQTTVELKGDDASSILSLQEKLEEDDDVQDVYGNYELIDEA